MFGKINITTKEPFIYLKMWKCEKCTLFDKISSQKLADKKCGYKTLLKALTLNTNTLKCSESKVKQVAKYIDTILI